MKFNPEDGNDFGPHCRNCHKGSSNCGTCHESGNPANVMYAKQAADSYRDFNASKTGVQGKSILDPRYTSIQLSFVDSTDTVSTYSSQDNVGAFIKTSRTVDWDSDWRESTGTVAGGDISAVCGDDGFSWPHRTLGWMMLKDDLFGLDFNGDPIYVGSSRVGAKPAGWSDSNWTAVSGLHGGAVHDIDSVCLDCHNPTLWNATSSSHTDSSGTADDDYNDELLLRGLP